MTFENVLPDGADTLLTISAFGSLLFQGRGLTQTLEPIKESVQLQRTVNGTLVDISNPIFRKYTSRITCSDVDPPPLDNLWAGMEVTVGCAVVLCYATGNSGSPFKPEVSGSSYVDGSFTFYRPLLDMRISAINESFDEWKCATSWTIELEEI